MKQFELCNENDAYIAELVHRRKDGAFIMPLYVKMYNDRIPVNDINSITNFNQSGLKIGYGAVYGLFEKCPFPIQCIDVFDIIYQFKLWDDEKQVTKQYYVFESSYIMETDHPAFKLPIIQQMNYYYDMFSEYLTKQHAIHRKKMLDDMMNS